MTQASIRNIFIGGTVFFSLLFLYLSYDSLRQMPLRTNEATLTPQVVAGKHAWQKYNCNDCHTILGIGGYYAPDITKVATYRDADWLGRFLKDPEGVWAAKRRMPKLPMSDAEVGDLVAFMGWVSKIDTNDWPRKPMLAAGAPAVSSQAQGRVPGSEGPMLFARNGCQGCHKINGVGGAIGPDLTHVGSRLPDKQAQISHLRDPRSIHPQSSMPAFGKMSEHDLEELAEYLVSLK
ncbi:MAG TPA: c-type cytochrome [Nitrospirota bacterium]